MNVSLNIFQVNKLQCSRAEKPGLLGVKWQRCLSGRPIAKWNKKEESQKGSEDITEILGLLLKETKLIVLQTDEI